MNAPRLSDMSVADAYRRLGLDSRRALVRSELADLRRLDQCEAEAYLEPLTHGVEHLGRPQVLVVGGLV